MLLHTLGLENLDLLLRVSERSQCLTALMEDADDKRLESFELARKANVAVSPDPV